MPRFVSIYVLMTSLKRTNSDNQDFQFLINELDLALCELYGTKQEDYAAYNKITGLNTVVVAYLNDEAVGCGCFKEFDQNTIEIKRMYVLPPYRNKGIARNILSELENWGAQLGNSFSILETGKEQKAAIAMYQQMGYEPIPGYNAYDALEISRCFKKNLIGV